MKTKILIFILAFTGLGINLYAQKRADPNPKIRELKINILLQHMALNEAEKSKFLPIYNKYSDENLYFVREIRKIKNSKLSDAEKINQIQKLEEQKLQLKKKYNDVFLKFLTPHQVVKMREGEEAFRKKLLEEMKNK